jgi:hypothetical protein
LDLIAAGNAGFNGVVFDPTHLRRHRELREQVLQHRLDAILDPKTQQSATAGGFSEELGRLPWGVGRPHARRDFEDAAGLRLVAALGDFAIQHGFTQVLSPTHLLRGADDPWLDLDIETARRLRGYLDRKARASIPIIYVLMIPYALLRDPDERERIIAKLRGVPISALWLRVDGFGAHSTPTGVRNYLEAAPDLHELDVPVVGDHVGGLAGLSLLAFGAVGGISHGVTFGERCDAAPWKKPRSGEGFAPQPRVYIPPLDLMVSAAEGQILLGTSSARARAQLGCRDTDCCARGIMDMIENPSRHFLIQRMKEVSGLSQVPETLRARRFLEQHVRPVTDRALAVAGIDWRNEAIAKKVRAHRKRLDALRVALGDKAARSVPSSFALLPETRASREQRP